MGAAGKIAKAVVKSGTKVVKRINPKKLVKSVKSGTGRTIRKIGGKSKNFSKLKTLGRKVGTTAAKNKKLTAVGVGAVALGITGGVLAAEKAAEMKEKCKEKLCPSKTLDDCKKICKDEFKNADLCLETCNNKFTKEGFDCNKEFCDTITLGDGVSAVANDAVSEITNKINEAAGNVFCAMCCGGDKIKCEETITMAKIIVVALLCLYILSFFM